MYESENKADAFESRAMAAEAPDTIQHEVERIEKNIAIAHEMIGDLEARIAPVLQPESEEKKSPGDVTPNLQSDMMLAMRRLNDRLHSLHIRLSSIHRRVQL